MIHIRNKNLSPYTVVVTEGWMLPLEQFPAIVEHPETFEISEDEIPTNHQFLIYVKN